MSIPTPLKLAIIVAAAILAAAINHRYLVNHTREELFVSVRHDVSAGEKIRLADLLSVRLGGDLSAARKSLLPWNERALLDGRSAVRDLASGSLMIRDDAESTAFGAVVTAPDQYSFTLAMGDVQRFTTSLSIGDEVQFVIANAGGGADAATFETCGPFAVQALDRTTKQPESTVIRSRPQTITLSTSASPDHSRPASVVRLMEALADGRHARVIAVEHVRGGSFHAASNTSK